MRSPMSLFTFISSRCCLGSALFGELRSARFIGHLALSVRLVGGGQSLPVDVRLGFGR